MRVVAKVPLSEVALEEALERDRLRRQRFISMFYVALCAALAVWYYAAFLDWPEPTPSTHGITVRFEWTWSGLLKIVGIGAVIAIAALIHVVRIVRVTRALQRLRSAD